MANFKEETEKYIEELVKKGKLKSGEIDELYIYCPHQYKDVYMTDEEYEASIGEPRVNLNYIQVGGKKIDWEKLKDALVLDSTLYDDRYGEQEFAGWITFKDSDIWLERKEYDGKEWWEAISKPTLKEKGVKTK